MIRAYDDYGNIVEDYEEQIRAEVIAEISREIRLLYGNEYEKQVRAEVIEEVKTYLRLHRKYAVHTIDDFVFYYPMYEWLEQLKEQNN